MLKPIKPSFNLRKINPVLNYINYLNTKFICSRYTVYVLTGYNNIIQLINTIDVSDILSGYY